MKGAEAGMDQNEEFINNLKIEDVPWGQITTAYGMATDLPDHLKVLEEMSDLESVREAFEEIASNIEHQDTLWHATPFALIFLVRIYHDAEKQKEDREAAGWLAEKLPEFFEWVIRCCNDMEEMEHDDPLPLFSDMLKEEYLWPEDMDEEEEEERWEEGLPDELITSYWHYSYEVVKEFDV